MTNPGRRPARPAAAPAVQEVHDPVLTAEVRRTNRLLAVLAVKGMEQRQAIAFLETAGFRPAEIATALGITRNAVNITLHRLRKADREPARGEEPVEEGPDGTP